MNGTKTAWRHYRHNGINLKLGLGGTLFRTDGKVVEYKGTPDSGGLMVWTETKDTTPEQLLTDSYVEV